MKGAKLLGLVLLILGVVSLAFGGFSYTDTDSAKVGPIKVEIKDRERLNVPVWAGLAAAIAGGILLARKD
jgi:hypothetical protein